MDKKEKSPLDITYLSWMRWFITPRRLPETSIEQEQAKQLAFCLFLVAIATTFNLIIWAINGNVSPFTLFGCIFSVSLYISVHLLQHTTVAFIGSILTLVFPYVLFLVNPDNVYPITVNFLIALSLLISSHYLSLRATLQITIIAFISAFFMNTIVTIGEDVSTLGIIVPFTIFVILTTLNAYSRARLIEFAYKNEDPTQAIFYQNAISLIPDATLIQVNKTIVNVNDAATHLLGLSRSEIIGQPTRNFISIGSSKNYQLDNVADNLTIRYSDLLHIDKGELVVHITASSITYVDTTATMFVIRPQDVSAEEQHLLKNIIDASFNAVLVTDTDLDNGPHIKMVNPAFCNMTGYEESELIGRTPRILQGNETEREILDKLLVALEHGANEFRSEVTNYRKDGTKFRVLWLIRPVYDPSGQLTHYLSIQQEITKQEQLRRDLIDREENLSIISEVMTDYAYMFEVTPENTLRFSWMTGAVESITGLTYAEAMLLGDWHSIVHEDDQSFYDLRTKNLLDGQTSTLEYRIRHQDGSIHWIQDKAHPIIDDASGEIMRILGAAHDITERIEAQETLKAYVVQQAVIAELGLLALNLDNLDTLLDYITDLCEQVLKVNFISIFEHRAKDNVLTCLRLSDNSAPFIKGESFSDSASDSLAGFALNHHEAIISDNLNEEMRFTPLPRIVQNTYKSAIGVVVLGRDVPFGVLSAFSDIPDRFAHDEVYFLQAIANILGTFIVRSHAQMAEREQTDFAEALREATSVINSRLELPEVLNKMITYVQQVVPQTQQATIMLLSEQTQRYQHYTTWGFAEDSPENRAELAFSLEDFPLLQHMKETGNPIYIVDTQNDERWIMRDSVDKTRSYLGAPIIVDNETIGFLNLHGFEKGAFSEKDAMRLKTFADKTSTAIVNARKQEDLEYRVTQRTAELRQEREQLAAILSGTGDGIYYIENDRIAFVNDTLCKMTGFTEEELLGRNVRLLVPADISQHEAEKLRGIIPTLLEHGIWRDTTQVRRKDNSTFEAGLTISSIESADNELQRSVTIVRDLSREKELEDLKRTFIAAAAHDLRSPISSLKMRMFMIKREPEKVDLHLERVNEIINHVNHLVNDLLDAHGRIVLRPQNIILQDVLDKVVDTLSLEAKEKGLGYEYQPVNKPALILADEHRLTQVFTNLITNAIHYTEANGCITITTKLNKANKTVSIEIQDTGVGIPAEEQESIFLPFYRTQGNESKGNGLGLSITREIVELHNGEITVESVANQGSTFIVTLPLSRID